jgi:predicted HicB family RNase H-like nuclease
MVRPIKIKASVLMTVQEHLAMKAIAKSKGIALNQLIIKKVLQDGL